jgi:hypothetical protein
MELKNVALTPEEAKDMYKPVEANDAPKYPYGLRLCLNKETLEKLGIGEMPVGTRVMVMGEGSVVSVNSHQEMDGDKNMSMDVQIEMLAVETKSGVDDIANRLYPNMKK